MTSATQATTADVDAVRRDLQTDLWALANVLYPPPLYCWSEQVHRVVCEKFFVKKDPAIALSDQDSRKKRLFLDPRNHFKTTLDIVDIVQWILCFPNVRILIASGTRDNAIKMLKAAKAHFQFNETLRFLFPAHCPSMGKADDFGTQDSFTCPARTERSLREPTVSVASPDSTVAGMHYEILKFDDLVNETNSRTKEGLTQVTNWYKLTNPLLERGGYRDVIGTRYDYSDLYGDILGDSFDKDHVVGIMHNDYLVSKRSCYLPDGTPLFVGRFDREFFEGERKEMGTFNFSAQYLNDPVGGDAQFFPPEQVQACFIAEDKLPKVRCYFLTLDLAISQANDADNTALVAASVGRLEGRKEPSLFVEEVLSGHLKPEQTVSRLFDWYVKYKPFQIRTEEVGFTALLKPLIAAESARRGVFLPMVWIKRDNKETKQARIAGMQPFVEAKHIRFVESMLELSKVVTELVRFPKFRRDDIIDAMSDQLEMLNMFRYSPVGEEMPEMSRRTGNARLGMMA